MAKVAITESYLEDIADAIRSKTGMSEETYRPSQMAPAIATISGSGGITPTGTINITENGTYNVTHYANANVSVPNSYSSSDEGKVVSNGALVAQSSATYTENGTYDTTLKNSVTVNVAGGGSGTEVVSVVDTPDSGGGTVRTITASGTTIPTPASDISKLILNGVTQMDVTGTTAAVSDVISGKKFTLANGTEGTGTGLGGMVITEMMDSGGGTVLNITGTDYNKWVRPSAWPDYDAMDLTNQRVIYATYDMSLIDYPFAAILLQATASPVIDIGYFSNGTFIVLNTYNAGTNTYIGIDLTSYKNTYDYIVARLTWGTKLTRCLFAADGVSTTIGTTKYKNWDQPIVEIYGNILDAGGVSLFNGFICKQHTIKSIVLNNINLTENSSFEAMGSSCWNLEQLYIDCTDNYTSNLYNFATNAPLLKDVKIPKLKPSHLQSAFSGDHALKTIDMSQWDFSSVELMASFLSNCYSLTSVGRNSIDCSCTNIYSALQGTRLLKSLTLSVTTSADNFSYVCYGSAAKLNPSSIKNTVKNISNMYTGSRLVTGTLDFSNADFNGLTNDGTAFSGTSFTEIIMPASLSLIQNQMFRENYSCSAYHFKSTSPPTLENTNSFNGIIGEAVIYVPYSSDHSILNAYKTATNWSTYASYIQEEPE